MATGTTIDIGRHETQHRWAGSARLINRRFWFDNRSNALTAQRSESQDSRVNPMRHKARRKPARQVERLAASSVQRPDIRKKTLVLCSTSIAASRESEPRVATVRPARARLRDRYGYGIATISRRPAIGRPKRSQRQYIVAWSSRYFRC